MKDKLIDINELVEILGYDSTRGVITWCIKHNILIITLGKKKYILESFLDKIILKETNDFIKTRFENPNQIMEAIENDDKIELSKWIEAPITKKVSKEFVEKTKRSKASENFLKNIKAI